MNRRLQDQEDFYKKHLAQTKADIMEEQEKIKDKMKKKISRLEYQLSALCSKAWIPDTESDGSDIDITEPKRPEVEDMMVMQQPSAQMLLRESIPRSSQTIIKSVDGKVIEETPKGHFVAFVEEIDDEPIQSKSVYPFYYARSYKPS